MKAEQALGKVSWSDRRWARAFSREIGEMDRLSGLASARDDGIAEGEAKGRVEGEAKGKAEERLEIARKLKARGRPPEEIAEDTGLPQEAIEKL